MKKVSRILAVVMAICLLCTPFVTSAAKVSSKPMASSKYSAPTANVNKLSSAPTIDGKFSASEWKGATEIEFTAKALNAGAGHVFAPSEDGFAFPLKPISGEGEGKAYMGWDDTWFYFALVVQDEEHTNTTMVATDLWKADCLQMAFGTSVTGARYEVGFALAGANRVNGIQWYPTSKDLKSDDSNNLGIKFGVTRSGTKTTYEVAFKPSYFKLDSWGTGTSFPLTFALHLYDEGIDKNENDGFFMEWGYGLVTEKTLTTSGKVVLAGGSGGSDSGSSTPTTTKEPEKTTTTTKKNDPVNPVTPADPTPTVTTTTLPPIVEEGFSTFTEDKATDAAEKVLSKLQEKFENIEIAVKEFKAEDQKLLVAKSETLKGVFVKDGSKYKEITGTEHAKDANWMEYDLGSKGQTVYVVNEILPTTTVDESATTTVGNVTTTTKGDSAKATTTTAADTATDAKDGSSFPWWIIIVVVVVLAAAGVGVWFFLKKKGDDADDTNGDNE